jgi:hypothetical protein
MGWSQYLATVEEDGMYVLKHYGKLNVIQAAAVQSTLGGHPVADGVFGSYGSWHDLNPALFSSCGIPRREIYLVS